MKNLSKQVKYTLIGLAFWLTVYPAITAIGGYVTMNLLRGTKLEWGILALPLLWFWCQFVPSPFWITGIPAIYLSTRLLMDASCRPTFAGLPIMAILAMSVAVGALLGAFIMTPFAVIDSSKNMRAAGLPFLLGGALGGAVTLPLVSLTYRVWPPDAPKQ